MRRILDKWRLPMKTRSLLILITLFCGAVASVQNLYAATKAVTHTMDNARKSPLVEISASRQCVGGREVAGFSARTAQEEKLTPPAGLKPVEQEAWLAMARRQGSSDGMEFSSLYPKRYNEPFVVEGEGLRMAVQPVGGTDVKAQIANGQVIYDLSSKTWTGLLLFVGLSGFSEVVFEFQR
jgi:hypothetical protein